MELNLSKPICFFDLETTGTNTTQDRIVEISVLKIHPDQSEEVLTLVTHPGRPIPEEVSKIHGIYDKDVAEKPLFKQVARQVADFFGDADLGGYNLMKFDIPVLMEEFLRADIDFSLSNRKIIDSQKIFYLMEPRTLTAALKYYTGTELNNAHSAEADTRATYDVLKGQLAMYDGVSIKDKDGNASTPIANNIDALHKVSVSNIADFAGRLVYNDKGEECFNFGKHRGVPVADVLKKEPGYYDWMMKGDFPMYTKKLLTEIKLRSFGQ